MDLLTAANAILNASSVLDGETKPLVKNESPVKVFQDITNLSSPNSFPLSSSFNALLTGKITSRPKQRTPRKRKRSSIYSDENSDPCQKTPKNTRNGQSPKENSPATPMSNLKLLTRVASMEEPMTSKKSLFRDTSNKNARKSKCDLRRALSEDCATSKKEKVKWKRHPTSCDFLEGEPPPGTSTDQKEVHVELTRKEKSLGFLCDRFLEEFPLEVSFLETPRKLVIDDVALLLNTERRRVYDIVNILESLNMAARAQKNTYQWLGKQHLENTLSRLKTLALKWGIGVHLKVPIEQSLKGFQREPTESHHPEKIDQRKERSLGVLCQKFLMLFLNSSPPHFVQLDTAIYLLLGREGENMDKSRMRGRRIYDIANVLSALELIKKLPQSKCFQYIGPEVEATQLKEEIYFGQTARCRHSLLPPLLMNLSQSLGCGHSDLEVTPYEAAQPDVKKGRRPRKLAPEFAGKGKTSQSCSEDRISQHQQKSSKNPSLQDICQVASMERRKMMLEEESGRKLSSIGNNQGKCKDGIKPSSSFHLVQSPRVALTFQQPNLDPLHKSSNSCLLKLEKLPNTRDASPLQTKVGGNPNSKPSLTNGSIIVLKRHNGLQKAASESALQPSVPIRVQVATRSTEERKQNLPQFSSVRINQNLSNIVAKRKDLGFKPVSSLPNVSLNTLSKSHYKTVIGTMPQVTLGTSDSNPPFRFIIGNLSSSSRVASAPTSARASSAEGRRSFVKVSLPSPDSGSSAESELESIFGDSFKFSRPKNIRF